MVGNYPFLYQFIQRRNSKIHTASLPSIQIIPMLFFHQIFPLFPIFKKLHYSLSFPLLLFILPIHSFIFLIKQVSIRHFNSREYKVDPDFSYHSSMPYSTPSSICHHLIKSIKPYYA